jgi:hypothetical protein
MSKIFASAVLTALMISCSDGQHQQEQPGGQKMPIMLGDQDLK